jgi:cellulose synthase/poly-beta-1,6-N-acetylglucosamine synthase-like glycosyltransferase
MDTGADVTKKIQSNLRLPNLFFLESSVHCSFVRVNRPEPTRSLILRTFESNAGTDAQFLAFFDVDMEPKADFLQRTLPVFYQYDVDKEIWVPDWKVGRYISDSLGPLTLLM